MNSFRDDWARDGLCPWNKIAYLSVGLALDKAWHINRTNYTGRLVTVYSCCVGHHHYHIGHQQTGHQRRRLRQKYRHLSLLIPGQPGSDPTRI